MIICGPLSGAEMTAMGTGPADDVDGEAAAVETTALTGELVLPGESAPDLVDESSAPVLPDEYYVALQPLTLDLVAVQLQRIGYKFVRSPERIDASWSTFSLRVRVLSGDILSVSATIRRPYPVDGTTELVGRCNWWNTSRIFLKAGVNTVLGQANPTDEDPDPPPMALAQVSLDLDLPLPVGVAPVQLQSLFRNIVQNVGQFEDQARLDDVIPKPTW